MSSFFHPNSCSDVIAQRGYSSVTSQKAFFQQLREGRPGAGAQHSRAHRCLLPACRPRARQRCAPLASIASTLADVSRTGV